MHNILTITLNPAVDIAARIDKVRPNTKLRCTDPSTDPGGGGVNVSRAIKFLGGNSTAFVATGGATGNLLVELLLREGITPISFETPGSTRQSFAATETASGNQFRYVLPGPVWTPPLVELAKTRLAGIISPGMIVVGSGSLPPGVPEDFFRDVNAIARDHGARLILDTSGRALTAALDETAPLYLLRLDREEAETLAGRSFDTPAELAGFARSLIDSNVAEHVVLALGEKGSVGVSAAEAFHCQPPKVTPDSLIGAGDSLVGALTLALAHSRPFPEAVAYGAAAAASTVTSPATRLCDKADTTRFAELTKTSFF